MNKVLPADRAEFALREEAGKRDDPGFLTDKAGVVMRLRKQTRAAAVAGEDQAAGGGRRMCVSVRLQERMQVLIGALGIPNLELDGLADADAIRNGQGPGLPVEPEDVADQKIAALERALVLVNDKADVQPLLEKLLVARSELLPDLLQPR